MTDNAALRQIARQERRFVAANCGRGRGSVELEMVLNKRRDAAPRLGTMSVE